MSPDVAAFLLTVLGQVQLQAGAPDFDEVASLIIRAKAELRTLVDAPASANGQAAKVSA